MYILYPNKYYEWAYVQDDYLENIWKKFTTPYEKFLKVTFKSLADAIFDIPVREIDDPDNIELPENKEFDSVWYSIKTPKDFVYPSEIGLITVTASITKFFQNEFINRIYQLYVRRFGSELCANILTIISPINTIKNATDLVEALQSHKNHLVSCAISRNYIDFNIECENHIVEMCNVIGNTLSAAHYSNNPTTLISELVTKFNHASDRHFTVYDMQTPMTLQLETFSSFKGVRKWYVVQLYKNGKLVIEKKGHLVHYAWMAVITKMLKRIEKSGDGVWTMVIGVAKYRNNR